ncbi:MAG: B12-binding domain-containing radical SAM protein, partial [bacterium]|nr:B12-binding domain-containing radical SAM protein [bacterium]
MKVLLVNPWIHDFAAFDLWSKPLGLLTIAAWLQRAGAEITLIDCLDRFHSALVKYLKGKLPKSTQYGSGQYFAAEITKPDIFKNIPRKYKRYGLPVEIFETILRDETKPDVIMVTSGMTYWYPGVFEAIELLKKKFPETPVVLGGIYARLCYDHALKHSGADQVYNGADMQGLLQIIEKLTAQKLDTSKLDKNNFIAPAYELYDTLTYITLRTSTGCPFKCSYCGWYLLGEDFRQEPVAMVLEEIERYWQRGVKNFAFYDDALLYQAEEHAQKLFEGVIKKKMRVFFHTPNGLHTRFMTKEIARLMREAGFVQPRLALETTSAERQNETSPKTNNQDFLQAVKYLKNAGYQGKEIAVNILIGLPGQDIAEIAASVDFIRTTGCRIFLEEYSPVPGTKDYKQSGLG